MRFVNSRGETIHENLLSSSVRELLESALREGKTLDGAVLGACNLQGVRAAYCAMAGANFMGSDLTGACLVMANAQSASFFRAILANCNARGTNFRHADLGRASLCGADFRDCDLRAADLRGALTTGTCWSGTLVDETTRLPFSWEAAISFGMRLPAACDAA